MVSLATSSPGKQHDKNLRNTMFTSTDLYTYNFLSHDEHLYYFHLKLSNMHSVLLIKMRSSLKFQRVKDALHLERTHCGLEKIVLPQFTLGVSDSGEGRREWTAGTRSRKTQLSSESVATRGQTVVGHGSHFHF